EETFEFIASEDATVNQSSPGSNYGNSSVLEVESPGLDSYMKFSVTGVSGTVNSAVIRVYATNGTIDGPSIYTSPSTWSESTINYTNRPTRGSVVLDDKDAVDADSFVDYDVTEAISQDGTYSFVLVGNSTNGADFASRTATNPPKLIIKASVP